MPLKTHVVCTWCGLQERGLFHVVGVCVVSSSISGCCLKMDSLSLLIALDVLLKSCCSARQWQRKINVVGVKMNIDTENVLLWKYGFPKRSNIYHDGDQLKRTRGVITPQEFCCYLALWFFVSFCKTLSMQMKRLHNTPPCLSEEISERSSD